MPSLIATKANLSPTNKFDFTWMTGCPNDAGTFDTKTCVLACENGTSTYFKNAYVEYSSPNQLGAGFDSLCMPYTTVSGNIQEFLMPGS